MVASGRAALMEDSQCRVSLPILNISQDELKLLDEMYMELTPRYRQLTIEYLCSGLQMHVGSLFSPIKLHGTPLHHLLWIVQTEPC